MIDRNSLLGRLTLITMGTVLAYATVVALVLSQVTAEHPRNQLSAQLMSVLISTRQTGDVDQTLKKLNIRLARMTPETLPTSVDQWIPPDILPALLPPDSDFALVMHEGERYALLHQHGEIWAASGFKTALSNTAMFSLMLGGILLLLIATGNFLLVRHLIKPIPAIRKAADRLAQGDLAYRIETPIRQFELNQLLTAINIMAERLQSMLNAKRDLLLAMGHEVRSPLARARVLTELMPEHEYRNDLISALSEMDQLTTTLLEAEALSGEFHEALHEETVSLRELASDCVAEMDESLVTQLIIHLPSDDDPALIQGDDRRLRLLLRNLLSNAIRHGGGSPVKISLSAENTDWTLSVADEGPGMTNAELKALGEAFYRPDPSRQRKTGGHGLGLYLCHRIAKAHNASLDISSEQNRGTTVSLRFRRSIAES